MKSIKLIVLVSMLMTGQYAFASPVKQAGTKAATKLAEGTFAGVDYQKLSNAAEWLADKRQTSSGHFGLRSAANRPDFSLIRTFSGKTLMVLLVKPKNSADSRTYIEFGQYITKMDEASPFENLLAAPAENMIEATKQLKDTARRFNLSLGDEPIPAIYRTGVRNQNLGNIAYTSRFEISGDFSVANLKRFLIDFHETIETMDGVIANGGL